jgi:preprotein translocase subunit SecD/SecD/SecF fusion protein
MDQKQRNVLMIGAVIVLVAVSWFQFFPLSNAKMRQGLDLRGGLSVILTAESTTKGKPVSEADMTQANTVILNRVNGLGVSEATVQRQGNDSLLVQLPGIKDQQGALKALGSTGLLEFILVEDIETSGTVQDGQKISPEQYKRKPELTGKYVTKAAVGTDGTGNPVVTVQFNDAGAKIWGDITQKNVGKPVAIILDGIVQSTPVIQEPILNGDTQISGKFTPEQAKQLAAVLQAGALPVSLKFSDTRVVGPTLGAESLRQGVTAAAAGLIIVAIYLAIFYRGLGAVAWAALFCFGSVYLGILATLSQMGQFALSLPGIAGMVLTIGLAADTSILMFERVKEEVRAGKTVRSAARSGTKHALWTSVDADVVTFVSAFVIYMVAIGPVKGFALTLMIGIATDLTIGFLFTRPVIQLLADSVIPKMPAVFGLKGGEVDA